MKLTVCAQVEILVTTNSSNASFPPTIVVMPIQMYHYYKLQRKRIA